MTLPTGTIFAACVPTDGAVAVAPCPDGYALTWLNSIPVGPGELSVHNVMTLMGAAAFFYGSGMLLGLIRKGV